MIKKSKKAGDDQYLALLNIRNTPTQGMDTSPVQRLLGRRTKTLIPTSASLLKPEADRAKETAQLKEAQRRQAHYYNKSARDMPSLAEGDTVRMKPFRLGETAWRKAIVTKRLDQRSYDVETADGAVYRRNRKYLRKTHEEAPAPPDDAIPDQPYTTPTSPPKPPVVGHAPPNIQSRPTTPRAATPRRSSRQVKPPERFKDYVV